MLFLLKDSNVRQEHGLGRWCSLYLVQQLASQHDFPKPETLHRVQHRCCLEGLRRRTCLQPGRALKLVRSFQMNIIEANLNYSIRKELPAFSRMGCRLVGSYRKRRIKQKHTLISPRGEVAVLGRLEGWVGRFNFLIHLYALLEFERIMNEEKLTLRSEGGIATPGRTEKHRPGRNESDIITRGRDGMSLP